MVAPQLGREQAGGNLQQQLLEPEEQESLRGEQEPGSQAWQAQLSSNESSDRRWKARYMPGAALSLLLREASQGHGQIHFLPQVMHLENESCLAGSTLPSYTCP